VALRSLPTVDHGPTRLPAPPAPGTVRPPMSPVAKLLFLLVTLLHLLPVLFLVAVIVGITLPVVLIRAD